MASFHRIRDVLSDVAASRQHAAITTGRLRLIQATKGLAIPHIVAEIQAERRNRCRETDQVQQALARSVPEARAAWEGGAPVRSAEVLATLVREPVRDREASA